VIANRTVSLEDDRGRVLGCKIGGRLAQAPNCSLSTAGNAVNRKVYGVSAPQNSRTSNTFQR
jgi:hypothetical protein